MKKPLTKKQTEILIALFNGSTVAQASRDFGVAETTINRLKERKDAQQLQKDIVRKTFNSAALKAANKLIKQIDDDNPWVAQNASRAVLEYVHKYDDEENQSVVVLFEGMTEPAMEKAALPDPNVVDADGEIQ